jgi:hypothetical protein
MKVPEYTWLGKSMKQGLQLVRWSRFVDTELVLYFSDGSATVIAAVQEDGVFKIVEIDPAHSITFANNPKKQ